VHDRKSGKKKINRKREKETRREIERE